MAKTSFPTPLPTKNKASNYGCHKEQIKSSNSQGLAL